MSRSRPLGPVQINVLRSLVAHGGWWEDGACGWTWSTSSKTTRIMESLLTRGLVSKAEKSRAGPCSGVRYELTLAGKEAAKR